ncbi:MAG: tRNA preQ1(34) S-adenosylmethionine ribosyltransferase-isomerase QueA [Bacteroidetes bacterium]|nr:tRNA preQ1(34) S-adenosylmethionine ribosyltransferase-isomerase QueA [Bacteroidota bacterium]MDA0906641.1 tRNA preQ1(34) S-adenosylmethionine ribosyltransferase-isomerase QueA [Bacteroidota bacterium]
MDKPTLSDFDYHLPEELIAQEPSIKRDHSRLLVYDRSDQSIEHTQFHHIGKHLPSNTTLVMNNTKVDECRLQWEEGKKEVFIVSSMADNPVTAMVRPGRQFKKGAQHQLSETCRLEVEEVLEDGLRRCRLDPDPSDPAWLPFFHTPFPPYIKPNEELADRYQTVYSRTPGSKAAPTAGLHFTPELLQGLQNQGIRRTEVTLNVGLGTFAPVKSEDILSHKMHEEFFSVSPSALESIASAKHITAVGTTSCRTLESLAAADLLPPYQTVSRETGIFIYPGYTWKRTNALLTNFHLPKSTLLMLLAALVGVEEWKRIYEAAIQERYRFYSFGDAMLVL